MKGFLKVFLITLILFTAALTLPSHAESEVIEYPNTQIFLNGKVIKITDNIISKNDCIMLPLKQVLISLGVKDNNKEIQFNDGVVTLNLDSKVTFTLNNKSVTIDDKTYNLEVAPFEHKNGRTYVPASFIAKIFGKVYAWDTFTKSVLINDIHKSDNTKQILEKSFSAMKQLKRVKVKYSSVQLLNDNVNIDKSELYIDRENRKMYGEEFTKWNDIEMTQEKYYLDNLELSRGFFKGTQERDLDIGEINWKINEYEIINILHPGEELFSNLTVLESRDKKHYIIAGAARPHSESELMGSALEVRDSSTQIILDKKSYLISSIVIKNTIYNKKYNTIFLDTKESYDYSDYEGKFNEPDFEVKTINFDEKLIEDEELQINEENRKKIDRIAQNSTVSCIDSSFSNPYQLDYKEGVMFIVIENKEDFKSLMELDYDSNKLFIYKIVNKNSYKLLGSEYINVGVVYDNQLYFLYDVCPFYLRISDSTISTDGILINVYLQDREKNTFKIYTK